MILPRLPLRLLVVPTFKCPINGIELTSPELNDISQVSVFSLPVFDPEKEMAKLRALWKKKWSEESLSPPLIFTSRPRSCAVLPVKLPEPSFFESDSESEDEELPPQWYFGQLGLVNG